METMSTISVQEKDQAVNVRAQRILPTEQLIGLKKGAYPWQPARPSDILSLFTFQDNLKELKDYHPPLDDVICTVSEPGLA